MDDLIFSDYQQPLDIWLTTDTNFDDGHYFAGTIGEFRPDSIAQNNNLKSVTDGYSASGNAQDDFSAFAHDFETPELDLWSDTWLNNEFDRLDGDQYQINATSHEMLRPQPGEALYCHEQSNDTPAESGQRFLGSAKRGLQRFKPSQVARLRLWLDANPGNFYPDRNEKATLASETEMTQKQIEAWFSRHRQRESRQQFVMPGYSKSMHDKDEAETVDSDMLYAEYKSNESPSGPTVPPQGTTSSHSSLDVMGASSSDSQSSISGPCNNWSNSSLPMIISVKCEAVRSLQCWSGSYISWWLQYSVGMQEATVSACAVVPPVPGNVHKDSFEDSAEAKREREEFVNDGWTFGDLKDRITSDNKGSCEEDARSVSFTPAGSQTSFEVWKPTSSHGSCMSWPSHRSANSISSRQHTRSFSRPRNRGSASSMRSSTSLYSSNSRQHGRSRTYSDMFTTSRMYKSQKSTHKSAVSRHIAASSASECEKFYDTRRRGRRTFQNRDHTSSSTKKLSGRKYWCTFCDVSFKDRYRWQRHEESVHCPQHVWICRPQRFEIESCHRRGWSDFYTADDKQCWSKEPSARTFYRKNAMKQHLHFVHRISVNSTANALNPIIDSFRHDVPIDKELLTCHICYQSSSTWEERVAHLSQHFETNTTGSLPRVYRSEGWSKHFTPSSTAFSDLEPFVELGFRTMKRRQRVLYYKWECPACPFETYQLWNIPHLHSCNEHWEDLHNYQSPHPKKNLRSTIIKTVDDRWKKVRSVLQARTPKASSAVEGKIETGYNPAGKN